MGKRVAIVIALLALGWVAFGALRWGVNMMDAKMRAQPELQPPAWQIRRQARQMAEDVVPDPVIGFRLVAHQDRWVETEDFRFRRRTGEYGFPHLGPWPDEADVIVLGDSLLLGEGVGVEKGFVARVDETLASAEVVNLGNPGAGIERQIPIYRVYGAPMSPEWVISCLFLVSDLEGDRHFRAWLDDSLGEEYNTFRLNFGRRNDPRPKRDLMRRLEQRPTFAWLQRFIEPLLWGDLHYDHLVDVGGFTLYMDRKKVRAARYRYEKDHPDLQNLTNALFLLEEQVNNRGGSLAVVLIPSKEELYAVDPQRQVENASSRVVELLVEAGIPFLNLGEVLRRDTDRAAYYPRDIHLNEYGNRVVAEAMAGWMATELLTDLL